jgi:hypothetical protein
MENIDFTDVLEVPFAIIMTNCQWHWCGADSNHS